MPLEEAVPLKEAVTERLALHRAKHPQRPMEEAAPVEGRRLTERSAQARKVVAERYAKSQSYREFLAAEAERAVREAEATVEVATRNAEAVAAAQMKLLAELEHWNASSEMSEPPEISLVEQILPAEAVVEAAALSVRMHEELAGASVTVAQAKHSRIPEAAEDPAADLFEAQVLDEEIAFRSAELGVHEPLPANLIEFPRQLVASRKARPRLAEGPLLAEAEARGDASQLRIFEVEPSQVSTVPVVEARAPDWSTMVLGAQVSTAPVEAPEGQTAFNMLPQTAPIGLRLMAALVDGCAVLAATMAFVAVFAGTARALPTPQTTGLIAILLVGVLAAMYQALFFTLNEATPGMRYARIGLCTFSEENPTRAAMRRRAMAMMVSAAPLGMGFLWAWLDDDGLGWHDRIARMYQRSY